MYTCKAQNQKSHDLQKSRDSPTRLGERYVKLNIGAVDFYNVSVVQAVTFGYRIYW